MKETNKDKDKSKNVPPNVVNLHSTIFSCYSQSDQKDTSPDPEMSNPKIGVSLSHFNHFFIFSKNSWNFRNFLEIFKIFKEKMWPKNAINLNFRRF